MGLLATKAGCLCMEPTVDFGVDLYIRRISKYYADAKQTRYLMNARSFDVQLKCTTESGVTRKAGICKYDLPVKNFNDLIFRRDDFSNPVGHPIPLVLMLVILPDKVENCLSFSDEFDKASLSAKAYWYFPSDDLQLSLKKSSQRIEISTNHQLKLDFFENITKLLFKFK